MDTLIESKCNCGLCVQSLTHGMPITAVDREIMDTRVSAADALIDARCAEFDRQSLRSERNKRTNDAVYIGVVHCQ